MGAVLDSLFSAQGIILIIAIIIFAVTVILVLPRLLRFLITLVLLFFAILSGFIIANHELVQETFHKETKTEKPAEITPDNLKVALKDQLARAWQNIHDTVCQGSTSKEVEKRLEEIHSRLERQQEDLQAFMEEMRTSLPKQESGEY